jgi:hypothetical protein
MDGRTGALIVIRPHAAIAGVIRVERTGRTVVVVDRDVCDPAILRTSTEQLVAAVLHAGLDCAEAA